MKITNVDGSIVRTSNQSEINVVLALKKQGYSVYKRGWPDFIAVKEKQGGGWRELRLVEVKRPGTVGLGGHQRRVAEILKRHLGVDVEVWTRFGPTNFGTGGNLKEGGGGSREKS